MKKALAISLMLAISGIWGCDEPEPEDLSVTNPISFICTKDKEKYNADKLKNDYNVTSVSTITRIQKAIYQECYRFYNDYPACKDEVVAYVVCESKLTEEQIDSIQKVNDKCDEEVYTPCVKACEDASDEEQCVRECNKKNEDCTSKDNPCSAQESVAKPCVMEHEQEIDDFKEIEKPYDDIVWEIINSSKK